MIDLPLFAINSMGIRYGSSKLFQILMPLASYLLIRDLLVERLFLRPNVREKLLQLLPPGLREATKQNLASTFEQFLGFTAWKIGCDLGFFLIVTGLGPWQRAFTWSGLLPYTLIQYFIYYLLGRRMLIEGQLNPFQAKPAVMPSAERPTLWKRLASKYLHEDLNATSEAIPLRQVLLKPLVDYGGLVLSWSMYTVGIFFVQSQELNLSPLVHFAFAQMLIFYLVNTYGYIIGFNIGEWIHFRLAWLEERYSSWARQQAIALVNYDQSIGEVQSSSSKLSLQVYRLLDRLYDYWRQLRYRFLWRFDPVMTRYGLNRRWALSAICGVYCVMLVAPSWSGWMMALESRVNQAWFRGFGQLDQVQLAQITTPVIRTGKLPDSSNIIIGFPAFWQALYEPEAIASNPPEILQQYGIDLTAATAVADTSVPYDFELASVQTK